MGIPGAAVRTQTHDSWRCRRGPRPESEPAGRRQTRLCLKDTGAFLVIKTTTRTTKKTTQHTNADRTHTVLTREASLTVCLQLASEQDYGG